MSRYEYLFLDADETLFDFRRAEEHALADAFGRFGLPLSAEHRDEYDRINKALWKRFEQGGMDQGMLKTERFRLLFESAGLDADPRAFSETYIDCLASASFLLEGAEEACARLSARCRLAIITNGIGKVQRARIGNSAIHPFIEGLIISEDAGFSKPDPRIFEHACRLLSWHDKEKMLMVGDSLSSDIKGGKAFGIDTCWANFSGKINETDISPTFEIHSIAELESLP